ncbi:kinase-like domain-containing protein [Rhodocollybia butyracea]|uniref:Kinase-like domain-containing protein n=1 Tax=Rhodocollybia butyracea TaxID=206335 RepID=A0A9P5Q8Y4_9AGAR|nr:kinase-like domain-containing protein [Rhodocollybia butyracea]
MNTQADGIKLRDRPGRGLDKFEEWWADRYEFLKEKGYMLRPRYRPGWKPSYKRLQNPFTFEDGHYLTNKRIIDALRISDSTMVAIKRVRNITGEDGVTATSQEEDICALFSTIQHASQPSNHSIPLLEVLCVPGFEDERLLVMPWMREPENPPFRTVGEGLQFIKEMLEGIQYMHHNNVAHRDCSINNMVMDAKKMYPDGHHPSEPSRTYDYKKRARHFSRTLVPPRYYLIDFGFSRKYESSQERSPEYAILSGGTEPPECKAEAPCDPFATDVFLVGNMIRRRFLDGDPKFEHSGTHGFEFLRPLVNDMIQDDTEKRPQMDEVLSRFSNIIQSLSQWKLRSRAVKKDEFFFMKPFRGLDHLFWTCAMIARGRPAIPSSTPAQKS